MISRMTTVLQRLKTEWAAHLPPEAILAACEAVGYTEWRDRLSSIRSSLFRRFCCKFSMAIPRVAIYLIYRA